MKYLIWLIVFALPSQLLANDILGVWKSNTSETGRYAHIEFKPCDEKFCGTIIGVFNKDKAPIAAKSLGKMIAVDLEDSGSGNYINGTFHSPTTGEILSSNFVLKDDRLYMRGCTADFCRTGAEGWQRVQTP